MAVCLIALLAAPAPAAQQLESASLRLRVVDTSTLQPIRGAHVTFPDLYLFWITDAEGYASITEIPLGEHRVQVSMESFNPLEVLLHFQTEGLIEGEVTLGKDLLQTVEDAMVVVSASTTGQGDASLRVRVTDANTRQPVVGARVEFPALYRFWITDPIGSASISGIPPGTHRVEVSRLGYMTVRGDLTFESGASAQVDFALTAQAIEIPGVTVAVRSGAEREPQAPLVQSGFYDRYGSGYGYQLSRQDIERTSLATPSDVMSQLPGVRVVRNDRDDWVIVNPRTTDIRSGLDPSTAAAPGDMRRGRMMPGRGCPMNLYVDGVLWGGEIDDLPLDTIEALEVYTGPSQIPPAFNRTAEDNCGVVLIWTQTGVTAR